MNHLRLKQEVYRHIFDTLGRMKPECGGVLAMQDGTLTDFYFDASAARNKNFYAPSSSAISRQVNQWLQEGKTFAGYIHSHNKPYTTLSYMDLRAACATMSLNDFDHLYMAILCGEGLYIYRVTRQGDGPPAVEKCSFEII